MPFNKTLVGRRGWLVFLGSTTMLILQGCANTPFGQQLADNFDDERPSVVVKETPKKKESSVIISRSKIAKSEVIRDRADTRKKPGKKKTEKPLTLSNPQPYRITIKLSKADPAAPAEAVTKALRMAGVSFEVEMIERVNSSSPDKPLSSSVRSRP